MFRAFERWLDPFPPDEVPPPPVGLLRFLWACTRGARGYALALALFSAGVSIYEPGCFPSSARWWTCSPTGRLAVQ